MAALAATHSATPSLQSVLNQTRLVQARQQADQAESHAKDLRTQADEAQREADSGQARVRKLTARQRLSEPTYEAGKQDALSQAAQTARDFLVDVYSAAAPERAARHNALKDDLSTPAVRNTQGQFTGRILDLKA